MGKPWEKYAAQAPTEQAPTEQAPTEQAPTAKPWEKYGGANVPGEMRKQAALKTLQTVGRVLDYPAGVARAVAAESVPGKMARAATAAVMGGEMPEMTGLGKIPDALMGNPPTAEHYFEEAGIPEGPEIKAGRIPTGVTPRDILSVGTEMVLDPLMASGQASKTIGKAIYKDVFKAADKKARRYRGMPDVSDVLNKHKISGTDQQIVDQTQELLGLLKEQRDAIIKQADDAGAVVSMERALAPGKRYAEKLAKHPDTDRAAAGKAILKKIGEQRKRGELAYKKEAILRRRTPGIETHIPARPPVDFTVQHGRPKAIIRKTEQPPVEMVRKGAPTYESLPGAGKLGRPGEPDVFKLPKPKVTDKVIPGEPRITRHVQGTPEIIKRGKPGIIEERRIPGQKYQKPIQLGDMMEIKTSKQKAIPKVAYEIGGDASIGHRAAKELSKGIKHETERAAGAIGKKKELKELNKEMGTILNTMGILDKEAAKAARKHYFTEVDGALAVYNPAILAGKQVGKITKAPYTKTKLGRGMQRAKPLLDLGAPPTSFGRALINLTRENE